MVRLLSVQWRERRVKNAWKMQKEKKRRERSCEKVIERRRKGEGNGNERFMRSLTDHLMRSPSLPFGIPLSQFSPIQLGVL